jgi:hypothetical protein
MTRAKALLLSKGKRMQDKGMHTMSDAILEQIKRASYEEGMRDALNYLKDLYDGVEDTDLWADYMKEEAN